MSKSQDDQDQGVPDADEVESTPEPESSPDYFDQQLTMDVGQFFDPAGDKGSGGGPNRAASPPEAPGSVDSWAGLRQAGRLEDRYDMRERLGVGGMGEVWQAVDRRLERPVAVKRLRGDLVRHPGALDRFLTEARTVARLNHPNIVQVYDCGSDPQGPYLVMELVEGESLAVRLNRSGPFEPAAAVKLIVQVCDALSAAHRGGIVHRDIKPANILLTSGDVPKLGDFGLARLEAADHGQTMAGTMLGTPDFMAPEQRADAHRADARSDLWSLAATGYQLLTGHAPRVILADRIPDPLRPVLLKALDEDPGQRYQTADEFRRALARADPSAAGLLPSEDPTQVVVKEVRVPSFRVEVEQVRKPQVVLPGLPPIPDDILTLEGKLEGLTRAVEGLEKGTHPSLRPAQQAVAEAEQQFERLQQDLDEHIPDLPEPVQKQLAEQLARNPKGSISQLCALAPGVSTRMLLPYLQRLRNVGDARRAADSARRQYDEMRSGQIADLNQRCRVAREEWVRRQERALDAILDEFFGRAGATDEFPLPAWIEFEPQLETRRLPWQGHELLKRAEAYFLRWRQGQGGETPVPIELAQEEAQYVSPEPVAYDAGQARQDTGQPRPDSTRAGPSLRDLNDEKTWAMFCHLGALAGGVVPLGNILGPLVVWLAKRDEFPLVDDQGKEALNFQISLLIYMLPCLPLALIGIGILLIVGLAIFGLVQTIMAAMKAYEGVPYRYPISIRFLK